MEPEQPSSEASDDAKPPPATTEHHQQPTTTDTTRSYECNFCKRGFTNAQALGGHMNIHRKDKTKFKHSASTTVTPSRIAFEEPPSPTRPRLTAADPFSISHQGNLLSVPQRDSTSTVSVPQWDRQKHLLHQPRDTSSPEGDVDLELRLGHVEPPPPPESSSENKTTTTTRKFF